jgi:hypothetical protein
MFPGDFGGGSEDRRDFERGVGDVSLALQAEVESLRSLLARFAQAVGDDEPSD